MPDPPAELEFHQRLQSWWAITGGAEFLAAHARQVKHRDRFGRWYLWHCAVDDTLQPNCRASALGWIVLAKHEQFRHYGLQWSYESGPFTC
jgi:hypothetical protein